MKDKNLKYLYDIKDSIYQIKIFVQNKSIEDFLSDELLRSAVERKFEIIGEALNRIKKTDENMVKEIERYRDIISCRNILIHGYDSIDERIVWGVIQEDLDKLLEDIEKLINNNNIS